MRVVATPPPTNPTRAWRAPRVECLEARPEISAYAGAGEPWLQPQR